MSSEKSSVSNILASGNINIIATYKRPSCGEFEVIHSKGGQNKICLWCSSKVDLISAKAMQKDANGWHKLSITTEQIMANWPFCNKVPVHTFETYANISVPAKEAAIASRAIKELNGNKDEGFNYMKMDKNTVLAIY